MPISTPPSSQDRIAGALGCFLFFLPFLMGRKTEFTMFYSKQGLLLWLVWLLTFFVPFIRGLLLLILFCHMAFLAWQAYSGVRFEIFYLFPYAEKLIHLLKLNTLFSPDAR